MLFVTHCEVIMVSRMCLNCCYEVIILQSTHLIRIPPFREMCESDLFENKAFLLVERIKS